MSSSCGRTWLAVWFLLAGTGVACAQGIPQLPDLLPPGADDGVVLVQDETPAEPETAPQPRIMPEIPGQPPAEPVIPSPVAIARMNLVQLASNSGVMVGTLRPHGDPVELCPDLPPQNCQERWVNMRDHFANQSWLLCDDFQNLYCTANVIGLGIAVGIAAPLANTSGDDHFRHWYQNHVRGGSGDSWATTGRRFGDYAIAVPVVLAASLGGRAFPEYSCSSAIGDWGDRSLRAWIVGVPSVAVFDVALSNGRPGDDNGTRWHPGHGFDGVATEAFVGAVPILTAAAMTRNRPLRWALIAGSFVPAWAEINNDSHYLSQALLGWSIAFLSTCAVDETETNRQVQFVPVPVPHGMGMGVRFEY